MHLLELTPEVRRLKQVDDSITHGVVDGQHRIESLRRLNVKETDFSIFSHEMSLIDAAKFGFGKSLFASLKFLLCSFLPFV